MTPFNDAYFFIRPRTKKCRFCGEEFTTTWPAKRTCDKPECKRKAKEIIQKQNKEANARYQSRKRREYVRGLGKGDNR